VNDGHAVSPRTFGNLGHMIDEADLGAGCGESGEARLRSNHATLHLQDEKCASVRRHQLRQAISFPLCGIKVRHTEIVYRKKSTSDSTLPFQHDLER
jgi:hypothetical protein